MMKNKQSDFRKKKLHNLLWLLSLMSTAFACTSESPGHFTEAHRKAITDSVHVAYKQFAAHLNNGELEQAANFYADDPRFHWLEDGSIRYRSQAEVAQALKQLQGMMESMTFEADEPTITPLAPGVTTLTITYKQEFIGKGDFRFNLEGGLMMNLINTPDGWKFLIGHTSTKKPRG